MATPQTLSLLMLNICGHLLKISGGNLSSAFQHFYFFNNQSLKTQHGATWKHAVIL